MARRMMAAMAQQDCGQCGSSCSEYSGFHFCEERSAAEPVRARRQRKPRACSRSCTKKWTTAPCREFRRRAWQQSSRKLRRKLTASLALAGTSRDNPSEATFRARTLAQQGGIGKRNTGMSNSILPAAASTIAVGDAFGVYPKNDPKLVEDVLRTLGVAPDYVIGDRTFRQVLTDSVSLSPAPDSLFQLVSYITGGERRQKAKTARGRWRSGRRRRNARCAGGP